MAKYRELTFGKPKLKYNMTNPTYLTSDYAQLNHPYNV